MLLNSCCATNTNVVLANRPNVSEPKNIAPVHAQTNKESKAQMASTAALTLQPSDRHQVLLTAWYISLDSPRGSRCQRRNSSHTVCVSSL